MIDMNELESKNNSDIQLLGQGLNREQRSLLTPLVNISNAITLILQMLKDIDAEGLTISMKLGGLKLPFSFTVKLNKK